MPTVDSEFCDAVAARLDQHGDTITDRPVEDALLELQEEALDIAGWLLVARTVDPDLDTKTLGLTEIAIHHAYAAWMVARHLRGIAARGETGD